MSRVEDLPPPSLHEVYGAILGVDLQGYSRSELSESDRSRLREAQQRVIWEAVTTVAAPESCAFSDTGDGMLVVFPPDMQKKNLVIRLIPALEQLLLEHNHAAAAHLQLRARVVLHHGEVVLDRQPLTGDGMASTAVNVAARLLECETLRVALRRSPDRFPLALLVSDTFYENIILGQLVIFRSDFQRLEFSVKGQELVAWIRHSVYRVYDAESVLPLPRPARALVTAPGTQAVPYGPHPVPTPDRPTAAPPRVTLADLGPTCVYVSTADVHNYKLYEGFAERVPLTNHLETSLLLGRHAIVHCADPYRSAEVCDLINRYQEFVRDGSLLFLLDRGIEDVRRDFGGYLHRKAMQYIVSGHGEADIESLSRPWDAPGRADRAIELISMSPVRLYRGYRATVRFIDAVRNDLNHTEKIILYDHVLRWVRRLNLTLFQLLYLERRAPDGRVVRVLADDETINRLMEELEVNLERHSFSRQIFLSLLQEHLGEALPTTSTFYRLFAARISLLHLQINAGPHAFIECTPIQDADSPYFYAHLLAHIGFLSDRAPRECFGAPLVARLRALPCWPAFVDHHLRLLGDSHVRRRSGLPIYLDERFADPHRRQEFAAISAAVQDLWE